MAVCECVQVRTEEDAAVKPAYPSDKIRLGRLSFKGESPRMKKVDAVQCFLILSVGVLHFMSLSIYDLHIDVGIFIAFLYFVSHAIFCSFINSLLSSFLPSYLPSCSHYFHLCFNVSPLDLRGR